MKISTDGVLLGAVCNFENSENILDIGTGTGLLSMMAAQKSTAKITAVEIDKDAFNQAVENVKKSKFSSKIKIIHADFLDFYKTAEEKFDYIISNPPFFENSQKSNDYKRNFARHTDSLPFEKMIQGVKEIIKDTGLFSVIIPFDKCADFVRLCALNKLHLCKKVSIFSKNNVPPLRVILTFSREILPIEYDNITIYENGKNYSEKFKELTKDFYLK
ncbi:MAG: tRNA (adenine(22)-N(1))-methyltransferase TrmK [Bacteroidales bacterium]|nr:tRNA (adenine(22)-N(1))-methyltransferase TrmK [Bacteroidales bacterium]